MSSEAKHLLVTVGDVFVSNYVGAAGTQMVQLEALGPDGVAGLSTDDVPEVLAALMDAWQEARRREARKRGARAARDLPPGGGP